MEDTTERQPDFKVEDHGSICILQPISPEANEWADEHISYEMTWAGGIVVEPRYLPDIVDGIVDSGLTVQ